MTCTCNAIARIAGFEPRHALDCPRRPIWEAAAVESSYPRHKTTEELDADYVFRFRRDDGPGPRKPIRKRASQ